MALLLATPVASAQISSDTLARRLIQEGRIDEALSSIDASLRQRPRDGQLLLLKGAALSSANRKAEAIKVFRRMIEDKIDEAAAYNNLAVIYASRGEFESARTALEWAVNNKPDYATAYNNLGRVYASLASVAYKRALQLDRSDRTLPTKLAQLGEVLDQTGRESASAQPITDDKRDTAPIAPPSAPIKTTKDQEADPMQMTHYSGS